jgi:hypothetical protein
VPQAIELDTTTLGSEAFQEKPQVLTHDGAASLMTKNPNLEKLVCRLCNTLSDINAMRTGALTKSAEVSARALEANIKQHLEPTLMARKQVARALIYSGSPHLAHLALQHHPYMLDLEATHWRRLIGATSPDDIRSLLQRGLSIKNAYISFIGQIAAGHPEYEELLIDTATYEDHSILTVKNQGLLHHTRARSAIAKYLEIQVAKHRGQYRMLALNFIGDGRLYHAALIHAAGLPIEDLKSGGLFQAKSTRWFRSLMQSNHGKLALAAYCHSVEDLLGNRKKFEAWANGAIAAEDKSA